MVTNTAIEIQVDYHPSGNHTLKERQQGTVVWIDITDRGLWGNPDAAQFYQALSLRLADYLQRGVIVSSFYDTAPTY